jgi:hypothetical protein
MFNIYTEIMINAPVKKVWDVLTDVSKYPDWNPFIKQLDGPLQEGEKIMTVVQPRCTNPMTFHPKVLTVEHEKKVCWLGAFLFKGLFDGEHIWELYDFGDKKTKLVQQENFTGVLVPLFKKELLNNTKPGFIAMNESLKQRVEDKKK